MKACAWLGKSFAISLVLGAAVKAQPQPRTLSIVPIGGNTISGGPVTVEVFLTNVGTQNQHYKEARVELLCFVPAQAGGTGMLNIVSVETDPDGVGGCGPSSNGTPALFPNGVCLSRTYPPDCHASSIGPFGGPPVALLPPGESRYIGNVCV